MVPEQVFRKNFSFDKSKFFRADKDFDTTLIVPSRPLNN